MDTIMIFMFTHKKDGDRIEELVTIEELIYGIGDSKQPFKEYIEAYAEDGYKITNIEIEDKEDEYKITDVKVNTKNTRLNIPPYEFDDFLREFKELWCNKDYITDFCSFRKGEIYQILDKDEYAITLEDDNGKLVRFTYELANKCLFE